MVAVIAHLWVQIKSQWIRWEQGQVFLQRGDMTALLTRACTLILVGSLFGILMVFVASLKIVYLMSFTSLQTTKDSVLSWWFPFFAHRPICSCTSNQTLLTSPCCVHGFSASECLILVKMFVYSSLVLFCLIPLCQRISPFQGKHLLVTLKLL